MEHLNEEQLVMHHYRDDDAPLAVEQHLAACNECRGELEKLRRVLALVDKLPVPDRSPAYGEQMWNRLRWKLERRRRRTWLSGLAAAAVLVIAFLAGEHWHRAQSPVAVATTTTPLVRQTVAATSPSKDRVLVVVVGDHLDNSERMLLEVANADAKHALDLSGETHRAAELVASNRMYRQTALRQGDERIASLLADIEPILVELAHAEKLSPEELRSLQKRIDSKGLLFKVRVFSADAPPQKGINSL